MPRLRPRPRRVATLALAAAALAAGCSGDDDDAAPRTSTSTSTSGVPSSDSTVVAATTGALDTAATAAASSPSSTIPGPDVSTTVVAGPAGDECGLLAVDTAAAGTLGSLVASTPSLSTLADLLAGAGLTARLDEPGPLTLMAPTDAAFDALDPAVRESLVADPTGGLARMLGLHIVQGEHRLADLLAAGAVSGPSGTVTASEVDGRTVVDAGGGPAAVGCQDVATANGLLHLVDAVLLPPPVDTESVGGSRLYRVDPATGAATPAGAFGEELGVLDVAAVDDRTLLALTDGAELLSFSPAAASAPTERLAITGVEGVTLLALDRAGDGTLLAVSDQSGVYRIDPATGAATAVGPGLDPGVDDLGVAADVGTDGRLRVIVATGLDVSVDAATGVAVAQGPAPAFAPDDPNAGALARLLAIASTPDGVLAVEATTASLTRLDTDGQLTTIGPLGAGLTDGAGLDATPDGTLYLTVPG